VLTGSPDELYVIVDDSNIYIEGKFAVAEMECIGVVDDKRKCLYFNQLRLDYGRLLKIIQKERTIGENPIVVGSIPPTDSLWEMIRNDGFTVKTYPRNADNREKRVDMRIGQYINGIFRDKVPGVLALVAGDGDFQPVIQDAVQLGWMVEIYFWNSANSLELLCDENTPPLGVSGLLLDLELESKKPKTKEPVFHSLDPFYKTFSYGYGFPRNTKIHKHGKPKNMEVLHFTGHDFSLWKNDKIVIFDKGMFVWWFKEEDNLWMYFKNRRDLGKAKDLMLKTYPEIMEV
ncbi:8605_t:CDS:2, partial [Paraglomus occultum]